ncbi:MAG: hypothetical protein HYW49_10980 [Deltaproteobacteria bacterium]|nr:hypothetical protein [Deltaproteobacteria bacterium]
MIKADGPAKVKAALLACGLAFLALFPAKKTFAEIKPIEAEEFRVRLDKTSRSGRVLLLEEVGGAKPKTGKILLLKSGQKEIAAVRVLKRYSGKFAAKIIMPFEAPRVGEEYRALRKLGDKVAALVREREKRMGEPGEPVTEEDLSQDVSPEDTELDRGIPAPAPPVKPEKKPDAEKNGKDEPERLFTKDGDDLTQEGLERLDDESYYDPFSDEMQQLDPSAGALTVLYASVRNVDKDYKYTNYSSFGLRYGYNFGKRIFASKRTLQDMFTAEIGVFYYSISSFRVPTDGVTITPVIPTLRYSLLFGPYFSLYAYGGAMLNIVAPSTKFDEADAAALAKTQPALGLGTMLAFGPGWALRIEYGLDLFGVGIVLKF